MHARWPALLFTPVLAGCVSSGGADAIKPMASDWAAQGYVAEVMVTRSAPGTTPEFEATFRSRVQAKLEACAKGRRPLRLEVGLAEFHRRNAFDMVAAGDSNRIKGSARLVDPATGSVVGDYDVTRSIGGGGWGTALATSSAEEDMSDAFAEELCKRAFVAR